MTTPINDPDLWQHLAVGRAIWTTHSVPGIHQWTWPRFGEPEVLPSWGFRFLLWPVSANGELWPLMAWRWITTLAAFAFAWRTARVLNASPLLSLAVVVWCALIFRQRSMVRPDTLVAILLAAEIWLLELRRQRGRRVTLPLVLVAAAWANVHLSYFIGLIVLAIYAVAGHPAVPAQAPRERRPTTESLWPALVGAVLVSFVNPFGWRALWEPFRFMIEDRSQPIFASVGELRAIDWTFNLHHGLPVLMVLWPLLILLTLARRRTLDLAEAGLCLLTTTLAVTGQRFVGYYAIVAAPFVARGLTQLWAHFRLPAPRPGLALACFGAACALGTVWVCTRPLSPFGFRMASEFFPVRACDFIEKHGIHGRGFNLFEQGGYQVWRFWPDRSRLPFMDIHQSGSAEDRLLVVGAMTEARYWHRLDAARRFDYLLLRLHQREWENLHDIVERDSAWALVFLDDAAALYLRRDGAFRTVVDSFAFRRAAAGRQRIEALGMTCNADTAARSETRRELERIVAESPDHTHALSLLANVAIMDRDTLLAQNLLRRALARRPGFRTAHLRLGWLALMAGRPAEALEEFRREREGSTDRDVAMASAYRALGDQAAAAKWYRKALRRDPGNQTARDSLAVLGAPSK